MNFENTKLVIVNTALFDHDEISVIKFVKEVIDKISCGYVCITTHYENILKYHDHFKTGAIKKFLQISKDSYDYHLLYCIPVNTLNITKDYAINVTNKEQHLSNCSNLYKTFILEHIGSDYIARIFDVKLEACFERVITSNKNQVYFHNNASI